MEQMKKYKPSQYNIIVNQDENETILYNTFSGGIMQLDNTVYQKLYERDFIYDSFPYFEELKRDGYVVDAAINEFNRVNSLMRELNNNIYPEKVSYVIAPTLNCNLHCVYCFQKDMDNSQKSENMTFSTMEQIVDFIMRSNLGNAYLKTINISWFGGEPMFCFDKILDLSKLLKEKLKNTHIHLTSRMTTNGTLLNEERIKTLIDIANLQRIQITVDGSEKIYCKKKQTDSNTFNKVIENIVLATHNLQTTVRFNADKNNFEDLKVVSQMLYEMCNRDNLKIHFAQLRNYNCDCDKCFFKDDEYSKAKTEFYQNLFDLGYISQKPNVTPPKFKLKPFCGFKALKNFVIDPLGNLYKCEHNLGDITKIIGDVKNGIYYNEEYQSIVEDKKPTKCAKCEIFPFCNYAACSVMQSLTGDENCRQYAAQLKVIIGKCNKYCKETKEWKSIKQ